MRKPRSYAEVYNDLWSDVVNVFRVLRDPQQSERLAELLRLTPFSREEFESEEPGSQDLEPVERARRTVLRSFAGFGSASTNGEHRTGFRANAHRSFTTPAHDWARYPAHVATFCARLTGVCIENRPAIDTLRQHDRADTLFYVDPPYPHATRNMDRGNASYTCEMSDADHRELGAALRGLRGMVVLSGYPCALYDRDLFPDWERHVRSAFADGARERTEVLWLNPACSRALAGGLFRTGGA